MPQFDQIVSISKPGGQKSLIADYGWRNRDFLYGSQRDVIQRISGPSLIVRRAINGSAYVHASEIERGKLSTYDQFEVDRAPAGRDYRLSWSGATFKDEPMFAPTLDEWEHIAGVTLGVPSAIDTTYFDDAIPFTLTDVSGVNLVLRNYEVDDDPENIATLAVLGISRWRKIGQGRYEVLVSSVRELNQASDAYVLFGVIAELVQTGAGVSKKYWVKEVTESTVSASLGFGGFDRDTVTLTRTYQARWSPDIGPYSKLTDPDGHVWEVSTTRDIGGRRRELQIECEREITRADFDG